MAQPYIDEKLSETSWIRTFDPSATDSEEYIWHRDLKNRHIEVLEGNGWYFQFDEELPQRINRFDTLFVPKMKYHRLLVGKTPLKIKIKEVD